jgi:hypothetical protein
LEAVRALVQLWVRRMLARTEMVPYGGTVIELWRNVYEQLKPLQQETAAVEWLIDDDYSGLSSEGEVLLDLMGYLPGAEAGEGLRQGLQLVDPHLKMWAAISSLRRQEDLRPEDIEAVAATHLTRITFWDQLGELGLQRLVPPQWAAPEKLAESALSRWLSRSCELNTFPEEIELMGNFPVEEEDGEGDTVFLFRFRAYPKPWEPGGGWMAGIVGPYRAGKPWSSFQAWNSMLPREHMNMLYDETGGACATG